MMPDDIDFYKDDLTAPDDRDLYAAAEVFIRMASPQPERTQEGYLLDFKETWSDSALCSACNAAARKTRLAAVYSPAA